jgi:hypothetical protein
MLTVLATIVLDSAHCNVYDVETNRSQYQTVRDIQLGQVPVRQNLRDFEFLQDHYKISLQNGHTIGNLILSDCRNVRLTIE